MKHLQLEDSPNVIRINWDEALGIDFHCKMSLQQSGNKRDN